jgi:hypothetical protein
VALTLGRPGADTRGHIYRQLKGHVQPRPESALSRVACGAQRLRRLRENAQNPCKTSFTTFLSKCIYSVDEARGGQTRPWPTGLGDDGKSWDTYWSEIEDALLCSKLLMLEKARRVLASWCVCAFDLWLCGGGTDSRWTDERGVPVLTLSDRNRKVFLQARKAEGPTGSEWFIAERVVRLLENFEKYGGRDHWPEFPHWKATCGLISFDNGARQQGVPQGPDQVRGAGATLLHCEEAAFWERAKPTIGGVVPTLRGGGHIVLVTTANVGSYAKEIRDDRIRSKA